MTCKKDDISLVKFKDDLKYASRYMEIEDENEYKPSPESLEKFDAVAERIGYCFVGWVVIMSMALGFMISSPILVLGGSMMGSYSLFIVGKFWMLCAPTLAILGTTYCLSKAIFGKISVAFAITCGVGYWAWSKWGESITTILTNGQVS